MSDTLVAIQALTKALEAGNYAGAHGSFTQGAALQMEDLSPVITNVCFDDKDIKLQKLIPSKSTKAMTHEFTRQLSYGQLGGSAQLQGNVGREETSDYVRVTVPMCFYSHYRRVTLAATLVDTVDGVAADDRAATDAAKKVAGDMEIDCFKGRADFSDSGVFQGNPNARSEIMPNMLGLEEQIRESDILRSSRDLMFSEYGSDESVALAGGGAMTQDMVEDIALRASLNFSAASDLFVSPKTLSAYNKLAFAMQRIVLSGSAQGSSGADLRVQHTSVGDVKIESAQFLRGKEKPNQYAITSAIAPSVAAASAAISGVTTTFQAGAVYQYAVTTGNEQGESQLSTAASVTVSTTGYGINVTITHPGSGTSRWFNVYRTAAGGAAATVKYIGRVKIAAGASTTVFRDLGNRLPGFSTGFLVDKDTMELRDLMPFTRVKLAQTDLSMPEAFARFSTLAVTAPRKNALLDNLL